MNVLIIDDDVNIRRAVANCFIGIEVSQAGTLLEALKKMHGQHFDLIIADLILPDSDPLNTIIEVRRSDLDSVLVAITGAVPDPEVSKYADGIIQKPFRGCEELAAKVMKFMEAKRKSPAYTSAVKAISSWAKVFGYDHADQRTPTPGILSARQQAFHRSEVAAA